MTSPAPLIGTHWGQIQLSDAHLHFFSHRFFSLLAPDSPVEDSCRRAGVNPPPEDPVSLALHWTAELDRHAVASSALFASLPGDESSVAAALRAAPGRFHGFFFSNPLSPQSLASAQAAFDQGFSAICLLPAMHGYALNDERVAPLIELAEDRRKTVFVHCGVLSVGIRKRLGLPSRFDLRFSNPVDLHPIALRHDKVSFILPHFGAGYFREALMLASLCPNVFLDTSSSNAWRRFLTPPPTLDQVFERALEVLGDSRLLFGTDSSFFPRGWRRDLFDEQAACLQRLGASAESARRIFGANFRSIA